MISLARSRSTSAPRALACALVIGGGGILASCSTGTIGDHLPTAVGGLPAGVPQRPTAAGSYPEVHDVPAPREQTVLTDEERKKLEEDLIAARNRAAGAARAK